MEPEIKELINIAGTLRHELEASRHVAKALTTALSDKDKEIKKLTDDLEITTAHSESLAEENERLKIEFLGSEDETNS